MTVLMISHDLSVVFQHATNVLCLGRRRAFLGPPRSVLAPQSLAEIYGGVPQFHVHE
jgi:ABC-type Mn2+/Zn2+ transport system ATPase subunit